MFLSEKQNQRQIRLEYEADKAQILKERQALIGANLFPTHDVVMAMQVDTLKACLGVWQHNKKHLKLQGPPIFTGGPKQKNWLGGNKSDMQARLLRVVEMFKHEKPPEDGAVQAPVRETPDSEPDVGVLEGTADDGPASDEDEDEKYAPPVFEDTAYTVSAVLGSHKVLSELQEALGLDS